MHAYRFEPLACVEDRQHASCSYNDFIVILFVVASSSAQPLNRSLSKCSFLDMFCLQPPYMISTALCLVIPVCLLTLLCAYPTSTSRLSTDTSNSASPSLNSLSVTTYLPRKPSLLLSPLDQGPFSVPLSPILSAKQQVLRIQPS